MVVIRPVTGRADFQWALVNAYFKGWKLYAEIWLPALIYSGLHIFSTVTFARSFYHLSPAEGVIFPRILYYRSKTLLSPILSYLAQSLLHLAFTFICI